MAEGYSPSVRSLRTNLKNGTILIAENYEVKFALKSHGQNQNNTGMMYVAQCPRGRIQNHLPTYHGLKHVTQYSVPML